MSGSALLALAVFLVSYVLIATERIHRVAAALAGAAAMVLIGATDAEAMFFARGTGVDWNVILHICLSAVGTQPPMSSLSGWGSVSAACWSSR